MSATRHARIGLLALLSAFLALPILAAAEESPDYCGSGPVTIEVETPYGGDCDNLSEPRVTGDRESGYKLEITVALSVYCVGNEMQRWTDYPECGGERMP